MDALREIIAAFSTSFDGSETEKGEKHVGGFIEKLKKFGEVAAEAFVVHEVKEFAYGLAEQAEALEVHARTLGISTEALQKWQFAADQAGVSAETIQIGLQKLQRSAVGAGQGGGELAATFAKLHVDVKNASGGFKNADELLEEVAGAIGDMHDPTEQTAIAMQLFGRGGAALLPFLKQGREGMAALKEKVDELGGGFNEAFIEKSTEMIQHTKQLDFATRGLKAAAIEPLLPIITGLVKLLTSGAVALGNLVKHSNAAQAAIAVFGGYGIIKTIAGVASLATKLGFLKNGFRGLLLEILPLVAGFLILEDVWGFFSGADSVTGDLLDKIFGDGSAEKVKAFADMLASDVGPVFKDIFAILTDGKPLSVKFQELYDYIEHTLTPQFKADFGSMGESITNVLYVAGGLVEVLSKIVDAMKWINAHTLKPLTDEKATARAQTEDLNAQFNAGKPVATAADFAGNRHWYDGPMKWLLGFKPEQAVPERLGSAQAHVSEDTSHLFADATTATMPRQAGYGPQAPETKTITNTLAPVINVSVQPGTPESVARDIADLTGKNLRTLNALVPTAG